MTKLKPQTRTKVHLVETTHTDNVEIAKIEVGNDHALRRDEAADKRRAAWFWRFVGVGAGIAVGGVAGALYLAGDKETAAQFLFGVATFVGGLGVMKASAKSADTE